MQKNDLLLPVNIQCTPALFIGFAPLLGQPISKFWRLKYDERRIKTLLHTNYFIWLHYFLKIADIFSRGCAEEDEFMYMYWLTDWFYCMWYREMFRYSSFEIKTIELVWVFCKWLLLYLLKVIGWLNGMT